MQSATPIPYDDIDFPTSTAPLPPHSRYASRGRTVYRAAEASDRGAGTSAHDVAHRRSAAPFAYRRTVAPLVRSSTAPAHRRAVAALARATAPFARRRHDAHASRPRAIARPVLIMLALIVAAFGITRMLPSTAAAEAATSTPRVEWAQGTMPYLYQTDAEWAASPYAGSTVEVAGCGPTCLSMVYVYLTGSADIDPAAMARFSEEGGHSVNGMTAWTLMTGGAAELGLFAREVPADASSVADALRAGKPLIASVAEGDFTTTGHFIVLCGIDATGMLEVRDPNSPSRSHELWDVNRVLSQTRGLWSFQLA